MARKPKVETTDKLDIPEVKLFDFIGAIERKEYGFYASLSEEQQKKFAPFILVQWMSICQSDRLSSYYLQSTEYAANKYLLQENVSKHPDLQWKMLCAISPGVGSQRRSWIPNIKERIVKLKDSPSKKEISDYFKKVYPSVPKEAIDELTNEYLRVHAKKKFFSDRYPDLNMEELEILSDVIPDQEIEDYLRDSGE